MSTPQFQTLLRIGSGGMGEVLLALMTREGKSEIVALKRIHRELLHDDEAVARFLREQRITALLSNPNVVTLRGCGEDGDGPWIALEYVHGRGLGELINTLGKAGTLPPLDAALVIAKDVASGLSYAHDVEVPGVAQRGVLHRDLSPDNVLVAYEGVAKLADFGIAHQAGATRITQTGMVRGKFGYLSPELHEGGDATRASDIFALAATLYLLFTGAPPFHGKSDAELVRAVLNTEPTPPITLRPELPLELSNWLRTALSKTRGARPPNLRPLIRLLDAALGQDETLARRSLQRVMSEAFPEQTDRRRREVTNAIEQRHRTETLGEVAAYEPPRRTPLLLMAGALMLVAAGGYALARITNPPGAVTTPPPTDPPPTLAVATDAGLNDAGAALAAAVPLVPDAGAATEADAGRRVRDATKTVIKRPTSGELFVRVQPWAYVYVDGELKGTTPLAPFKVSEGKHTLLLVNDKLGVKDTRVVTVKAGSRKEVTVTLRKR